MRTCFILAGAFTLLAKAAPSPWAAQSKGTGGCKKSTEIGTMGQTVGPALSSALGRKFGVGNVLTQGVNYPADIGGAVSSAINPAAAPGSKDMTKKVKALLANCPETKIILSGYSQGAEQVHVALQKDNLGPEGAKIAAAITYGGPMAGERTKALGGWGCLPESRTQVNCARGDGVCTGAFSISAAHLSYTADGSIAKGVNFAAQIVNGGKLEGNPDGACKYGINIADLKGKGGDGMVPSSGGGAPKGKGSGFPKGAGGASKGSGGVPKGADGAPKGTSSTESSAVLKEEAPASSASSPAAEPAASASEPVAEPASAETAMPGMDGMRI